MTFPIFASLMDLYKCSAFAGFDSKYSVSFHELYSSIGISTALSPTSLHIMVGSTSAVTCSIRLSNILLARLAVIASILVPRDSCVLISPLFKIAELRDKPIPARCADLVSQWLIRRCLCRSITTHQSKITVTAHPAPIRPGSTLAAVAVIPTGYTAPRCNCVLALCATSAAQSAD